MIFGSTGGFNDSVFDDSIRALLIIAGVLALVGAGLLVLGNKGRGNVVALMVVGSLVSAGLGISLVPDAPGDGELARELFATPTPAPASTPRPTATPTPIVIAAGSVSGSLLHTDDGNIKGEFALVDHRDFLAEAVFANPYSASDNPWSHGFMFRWTESDFFQVVGIRSDGSWFHGIQKGSPESYTEMARGSVSALDLSAFGENHIRVVASRDQGWLFVNGSLVHPPLDLSISGESGDVVVMSGFFIGDEVPGSTTDYRGFRVSRLPGEATVLSSSGEEARIKVSIEQMYQLIDEERWSEMWELYTPGWRERCSFDAMVASYADEPAQTKREVSNYQIVELSDSSARVIYTVDVLDDDGRQTETYDYQATLVREGGEWLWEESCFPESSSS